MLKKINKINVGKHNFNANCDCPDCSNIRMLRIVPIPKETTENNDNLYFMNLPEVDNSKMEITPDRDGTIKTNVKEPAVKFDDINVYTQDNIVQVPASVYNSIGNTNDILMNRVATNDIPENGEFNDSILINIVSANICCIVDRYLAVLSNIYHVYIQNIKDNVCPVMTANTDLIPKDTLADMIIQYCGMTDKQKANADFSGYVISALNEFAGNVFNDTKVIMDAYVVDLCSKEPTEDYLIKEAYEFINKAFSRMMGDMIFEAATFIHTIEQGQQFLFNIDREIPNA